MQTNEGALGNLFSYNTSTGNLKQFYTFTNEKIGCNLPYGSGLTLASNGYIYSATSSGGFDCSGNPYDGTIYRLNPSTDSIKLIYGYKYDSAVSQNAQVLSFTGNLLEY